MCVSRGRCAGVVASLSLVLALMSVVPARWGRADAEAGTRHVTSVGGRFIDAATGQGVVPTEATYRLQLEGERLLSQPRRLAVSNDGSFQLIGLPARVVAVEIRSDLPDSHLGIPAVTVRHGGRGPSSDGLSAPILEPGMNLRLVATRGAVIRGNVDVTDGPLPESAVIYSLWNPNSSFDRGYELGTPIDESGSFRVAAVPRDRVIRLAVSGLKGSGFLSQQALARAGDSKVRLRVERGLRMDGVVGGHPEGMEVHVIGGRPDCGACLRGGLVAEVDSGGRFAVRGVAPGTYDIVVRSDEGSDSPREVRALAVGVRPGKRNIELKPLKRAEVDGLVRGLPAGEAEVEVWWRGVRLVGVHTVDGRFSLDLPAGFRYSIVAQCGDKVAFVEEVTAPSRPLVMDLKPGVDLRAKIDGADSPLLAMAGRGEYRTHGWVETGADLNLGNVAPGEYRVQLLGFVQGHSYLHGMIGGVIPYDDAWSPTAHVQAGTPEMRLESP